METLYRKVAVSERMPKVDQRFIAIDYRNDKINEVELMVLDSQKQLFFYFPSDIHTEAPEYWLEEIPDPTAQLQESLNVKSITEIRDIVAKNRGYENWETLNGSDLYDSDIDEVARMYSESKTAQLKADKAELLSALKKCWEIIPVDSRKWNNVFLEVDSLIKKMKP